LLVEQISITGLTNCLEAVRRRWGLR